ncbi:MAG: biopolymer transporter ExbD [Planctomycetota bacterium]
MKFLTEEEEGTQFMVAPLIDIVFIMLIFFITTSALETFEKDVSIDLPKGDIPALATDIKQTVYVEVFKDGTVKLESRPMEADALRDRLTDLTDMNPELNVVVRADKEVLWQDVVSVIELVTSCKVTNLFYAITGREPEDAKK